MLFRSNLVNGDDYTFIVNASNAVGTGAASSPSNGVTPRTVPSAPIVTRTVAGAGEVTIDWSPGSNGGSPITSFVVSAQSGGAQCATSSATSTQCTISGLTNGRGYTMEVVAVNVAGTGAPSVPSAITIPRTVPGPPTITKRVMKNGKVVLSWKAPSKNGGSKVIGYAVYVGVKSHHESARRVNAKLVESRSFAWRTKKGVHLFFNIKAVNIAGVGSASNEVSIRTK